MKILLFGKNGQVGWELNRSLLPLGEVIALGRKDADFTKPESLRTIIRKIRPDVIVNAVAYTAVDKAETEEHLATLINGVAPGVIAEEARDCGALIIHYSTDYVFDGAKTEPYTEEDRPNPLSAYGRSKLAGEQAVQASGCPHLILRTSWVYSARGKNFLLTVLRLAAERKTLKMVNDQTGAPTWARNIADVSAHMLTTAQLHRQAGSFISGTYHVSAAKQVTWHGFSAAIIDYARLFSVAGKIITETVAPITTDEYPLPAVRPKNSQLNSGLLSERYGLTLPIWRESMELCLDEVLAAQ